MDAVNLIGETETMEVTSMGRTTLEDQLKSEWPHWKPGTEFAGARSKSDAERR